MNKIWTQRGKRSWLYHGITCRIRFQNFSNIPNTWQNIHIGSINKNSSRRTSWGKHKLSLKVCRKNVGDLRRSQWHIAKNYSKDNVKLKGSFICLKLMPHTFLQSSSKKKVNNCRVNKSHPLFLSTQFPLRKRMKSINTNLSRTKMIFLVLKKRFYPNKRW